MAIIVGLILIGGGWLLSQIFEDQIKYMSGGAFLAFMLVLLVLVFGGWAIINNSAVDSAKTDAQECLNRGGYPVTAAEYQVACVYPTKEVR